MTTITIDNIEINNIDSGKFITTNKDINTIDYDSEMNTGSPVLFGPNSVVSVNTCPSTTSCSNDVTADKKCCANMNTNISKGFGDITCEYNNSTHELKFTLDLTNLIPYKTETKLRNCLLILLDNGLNQPRILLVDPTKMTPNTDIGTGNNDLRSWPITETMKGAYSVNVKFDDIGYHPVTVRLIDNSGLEIKNILDGNTDNNLLLLNNNKYYMPNSKNPSDNACRYFTSAKKGDGVSQQDYDIGNDIIGTIDSHNNSCYMFYNNFKTKDIRNPTSVLRGNIFGMYYPLDLINPPSSNPNSNIYCQNTYKNNKTSNYVLPLDNNIYPWNNAILDRSKYPIIKPINRSKVFYITQGLITSKSGEIKNIKTPQNVSVKVTNNGVHDMLLGIGYGDIRYYLPVICLLYKLGDNTFRTGYNSDNTSNIIIYDKNTPNSGKQLKDTLTFDNVINVYTCCITSISVEWKYAENNIELYGLNFKRDNKNGVRKIDKDMNEAVNLTWQSGNGIGYYTIKSYYNPSSNKSSFKLCNDIFHPTATTKWEKRVIYISNSVNNSCPFNTFTTDGGSTKSTDLKWSYGPQATLYNSSAVSGQPVPENEFSISCPFICHEDSIAT